MSSFSNSYDDEDPDEVDNTDDPVYPLEPSTTEDPGTFYPSETSTIDDSDIVTDPDYSDLPITTDSDEYPGYPTTEISTSTADYGFSDYYPTNTAVTPAIDTGIPATETGGTFPSETRDGSSIPTSTPSKSGSSGHFSSGGLSAAASAGIGVGVALGVLFLAAILFQLHRRHRRRRGKLGPDEGTGNDSEPGVPISHAGTVSPENQAFSAENKFSTEKKPPAPSTDARAELGGDGQNHELPGDAVKTADTNNAKRINMPIHELE